MYLKNNHYTFLNNSTWKISLSLNLTLLPFSPFLSKSLLIIPVMLCGSSGSSLLIIRGAPRVLLWGVGYRSEGTSGQPTHLARSSQCRNLPQNVSREQVYPIHPLHHLSFLIPSFSRFPKGSTQIKNILSTFIKHTIAQHNKNCFLILI